ncbi:acyltransferase family protein [Kluyvera intermedia]|uniref:acyltransferase family protein n=1 Tax=Kluyvera intermedia TaxID=61648 RepID=UPI00372D7FE9
MGFNNKRTEFLSVQALRALAAVLVMCFHFREYLNHSFSGVGDLLFLNGDIGVDLFFLISGFIIYYITQNDNNGVESARVFFIKRFCRVFPTYCVITLLVAGSSIDSWIETAKSLVFIPLYTSQPAPWFGQAKLFVGWTLNYEFIFYTLFTLCMLFRKNKVVIFSSFIIAAVFIPALIHEKAISAYNNYGYPTYLSTITNSLMLEFLIGIFTAYLVINKRISYSKKTSLVIIAASFILFVLVIISHSSRLGGIGYIISSFMLLFSLTNHESMYSISIPKPIIFTGKISFSLYLVHFRANSLIRKAVKFHSYTPSYMGIVLFSCIVGLSFLLAVISYHLLEKKLSSKVKSYLLKNN